MEKIKTIEGLLASMAEDLDKFYNRGQNASGTRLRKSLNEVRKQAKLMRDDIKNIRKERTAAKKATKADKAPATQD